MTIQFEKLKARLLAEPKVKAEYDKLAPEFEIVADKSRQLARRRPGEGGIEPGISRFPDVHCTSEVHASRAPE